MVYPDRHCRLYGVDRNGLSEVERERNHLQALSAFQFLGTSVTAEIRIDNATLRFRRFRNPSPSLKEWTLRGLKRNKRTTTFENFCALKNINLSLKDGDRIGIIGLN